MGETAVEQSELAGRTALVTGAGQGIGEAVTRALVAKGAHVAAVDATPDGIKGLEAEFGAGRVTHHTADVSDSRAVEKVVDAVETTVGPLDILVNVAGVLRTSPVVGITDEDWAHTFAVNSTGVFNTSRAAARRMSGRRSGCIVTVGSNAAGVPRTSMAAYAASKAAATMFTKCLGLELARSGVRCNVVSPGSTDTAMQRALWDGDEPPARVIDGDPGAYRVGIPLGRLAEPADIADAVLFLVSDQARHITMHDLYVDGGATLRA
ncbi:2,3-dihydro-2,3-dihydroxybenzoate dehydrogenase [Streptomyces cinnamoneus]|uniref:2,3-dihydro-2,3-dihydroxybenzoate dehydrogenase n=1 Tax=Streptomyces cinnamoneus TaxID=53446 RepID=A0A2G1XAA9_STRCJ|nr:2,3-dihydro-2,3-dihydroxybenzoate dehydrogenase [Streptomyces cinnamoneus]PHQ48166.1 2,3-dihydro-2,3-dihydroxybenzoate dehydrogenase [Streptomyces cinnamoneus]PPT15792.1 2,3-dihydro-2,3-dihydroxybenzoate dehydrogenase [Streptomyces cinnamoneus]